MMSQKMNDIEKFCKAQIIYLQSLKSASLVTLRPGAIYAYNEVLKFVKDMERASERSGLQNRLD